MSFLAPLFLLGGAAVALPILFHFIRRTTRERKPFSSLMFLLPSPPRLTRRTRLEHLLLLALRCAVIGLLALGFSRPFFHRPMTPAGGQTGRRVLLLLDVSASMRRTDLWGEARKRAEAILAKLSPNDEVALFTFDRQINPLVTFDQWNATAGGDRAALITGKLAQTSPGWAATQLGNALIQAAETVADTAGKPTGRSARIELITDLQEGSRLESLQGYEWPKNLEVSLNLVKPKGNSNASLQLVADTDDTSDPKTPGQLRVRVTNVAGSRREQFKVGWALANDSGFAAKPIDVYVPPGQSRVVAVPAPTNSVTDRIVLQGDDDPFDNTVFATPPETLQVQVTYFGTEADTDTRQPLFFARRAFQQTRNEVVNVVAVRPGEPISAEQLQKSSLWIIAAPLSSEVLESLRGGIMSGKTLLVVAETSAMQATLNGLLGDPQLRLREIRPASYAMLGEIDFQHPIFAPFADPRFSDFTKIHFWKYARLDSTRIPQAKIVARFDTGDPALLEVPAGKGRVLVLTSGWQPNSSQLAVSSKFVPFLYSILETSGAPKPAPAQYWAGDRVSLQSLISGGNESLVMHLPDGNQLKLGGGETNFSQTTMPGVYTLTGASGTGKFVVNVDPTESRTTALAFDELERLGVPTTRPVGTEPQVAAKQARLQNAEIENRQKLWRWVIITTLLVLLVETWLAGRTSRLVSPAPAAAPQGT